MDQGLGTVRVSFSGGAGLQVGPLGAALPRIVSVALTLGSLLPSIVSCASGPTASIYRTRQPEKLKEIAEVLRQAEKSMLHRIDAVVDGDEVALWMTGWSHKKFVEERYVPARADEKPLERYLIEGHVDLGLFGGRWTFYLYAVFAPEDKPASQFPAAPPVAGGLIITDEPEYTERVRLDADDIEKEALAGVATIRRIREFRILGGGEKKE